MSETWLKVGELARRTGLTVRTLHHWDEIGLLSPGERTDSGHRLYGEAEVIRLQHIATLRALGFALEEIARLLEDPAWELEQALAQQLEVLEEQASSIAARIGRVERAYQIIREAKPIEVTVFLDAIKETIDMEKYYTEEQLAELAKRREALGEVGMQKAQQDWADLYEAIGEHMRQGTPPEDPALDPLVETYQRLIAAFTGGNPGIRDNLQKVYDEEGPEKASRGMIDPELFAYANAMMSARGAGQGGPPEAFGT